ncbi:MAG TPA: SRPBCC family protein [Streptosporangiaceae bacterium]
MRGWKLAAVAGGGAASVYWLVVRGALTLDTGIGRSSRSLGPMTVHIAAARQVVFDVVAAPYLGRTPRAMAAKLEVLERGSDMVLAAHHTPVFGSLTATTVETVRFTPPGRIDFRLVRGPVPGVAETFTLDEEPGGTRLTYTGTLDSDFWAAGRWWGERVARHWEATVSESLQSVKAEAERRSAHHRPEPAAGQHA